MKQTVPAHPNLVLDDDAVQRQVLDLLLQAWGGADTLGDGRAALELCAAALAGQRHYQLALLNIRLSAQNGWEILAAWRKLEREADLPDARRTRILMVTAIHQDDIDADREDLCDGLLFKPIMRTDLQTQLRRLDILPQATGQA